MSRPPDRQKRSTMFAEQRDDHQISPILCCIGDHPNNTRVCEAAARLATICRVEWHALHVESASRAASDASKSRARANLQRAAQLGAITTILSADDVVGAIVDHARQLNLTRVVLGRSTGWLARWIGTGLSARLMRRAPDLEVIVTAKAIDDVPIEREPHVSGWQFGLAPGALGSYLQTLVALAVVTGIEVMRLVDPASLAMLMVLSVALVSLRGGRRAAILTAVANLVIYDYLVVPPRYSFALQDTQYLVTFAVMLTVGLLIGELTTRLRFQARLASVGEQRAHALSAFSRTLSAQVSLTQVIDVAERNLSRAFASPVVVIGCDDEGQLDLSDQRKRLSEVDPELALRVFREQRVLGTEDATLAPHWVMIPLRSSMQPLGVVAMHVSSERRASLLEDVRELDTFAALIGLALERVHYVALSQDALLAIESERLRNSLLAALSHDLRTPLAGVIGLAESILYTRPGLSAQQHEMITEIVDEGRHMSASIDNLLEMAKLESGTVALRVQWQSVEEVVGSALAQTRRSLASHHVSVQVASGLPLVQFDAALITRVLVNLLENAAKYTPFGATIVIEARLLPGSIELSVADDGPGLPAGREEELFEKFARGHSESATGGVGLGLAICRSIVHAHGGHIVAEKGRLVGARFIMNLPLGEPPPVMGELESLANDN
jgi:two-component system sensor histidine kinase KdpD